MSTRMAFLWGNADVDGTDRRREGGRVRRHDANRTVAALAAAIAIVAVLCVFAGLWLRPRLVTRPRPAAPAPGVKPAQSAVGSQPEPAVSRPVPASPRPANPKVARPVGAPAQADLADAAAWRTVEAFLAGSGPADMEAIGRFLASSTVPAGWSYERMTARKDDLLNRLSGLANPPKDMIERLAAVAADPAADPAGRDYVLQYFREIYTARATASGTWTAGPEAATVRAAWSNALSDAHGTLAGTALLAWQGMSAGRPEFDPALARAAARRLLEAPEASDAARTTALAVCAQTGIVEAVPHARQLAETGATLPLRAAAISALGTLGGRSEQSWLEDFRRTQAPAALEPACVVAVAALRKRWNAAAE